MSPWEWPGSREVPSSPGWCHISPPTSPWPCLEIGVQHQALCHRVGPTQRRGPPLLILSSVYPTPGRKEDLAVAPDHEYLFGAVDVAFPLETRYDLHQPNSATLRIPYTTQPPCGALSIAHIAAGNHCGGTSPFTKCCTTRKEHCWDLKTQFTAPLEYYNSGVLVL